MPLQDKVPVDALPLDRELRGVFKPTKEFTPKRQQKVAGALSKDPNDPFYLVISDTKKLGSEPNKDPLDGTTAEITKRKQVGGRAPKVEYTLPLTDELTGSEKA